MKHNKYGIGFGNKKGLLNLINKPSLFLSFKTKQGGCRHHDLGEIELGREINLDFAQGDSLERR